MPVSYDLKDLISSITRTQPSLKEIYIFGSRAFGTKSIRSDVDLIVLTEEHVKSSDLRTFAMNRCPALDFFIVEGSKAISCMNDSFVYAQNYEELVRKLGAKFLWKRSDGFSQEFTDWVFEFDEQMNLGPTNLPDSHVDVISWKFLQKKAEQSGLPIMPYIGDNIEFASLIIADVAKKMILRPNELGQKGQAKNGWTVNLSSEYDCQNLLYTVLKPWIANIGREEVTIRYVNQDKIADFNLFDSKLIVELKFIDSNQKKSEVLKDLEGVKDLYKRNANVRVILLLVYVKVGVEMDDDRVSIDLSNLTSLPKVITKVIRA